MPLHKHTVRNDRAYEILGALTLLGEKDIPTAMTWPHAQFRRTVRHLCETIDEAKQSLRDRFTVWAIDKSGGEPTKDERGRRVPAVVHATNDDGSPKFKLDEAGAPTTEREIAHGRIQLTDVIGHDRAVRDLMLEASDIEVPHLSWPQLEGKLKTVPPNVVEALMDFFDNPPGSEAPPAPKAKSGKAARS